MNKIDLRNIIDKYASVKKLTTAPVSLESPSDKPVDVMAPAAIYTSVEKADSVQSTKTEIMSADEAEKPVSKVEKSLKGKDNAAAKDDLDILLDEVEAMFCKDTAPSGDCKASVGKRETGENEEADREEEEEGENRYSYEDSDWESADKNDTEDEELQNDYSERRLKQTSPTNSE